MFIKCEVPGCRNNSSNPYATFFEIPCERTMRRTWLKAINRKDLLARPKNRSYGVCDRHFHHTHMWVFKQLKPEAIPIRNLHYEPPTVIKKVPKTNKNIITIKDEPGTSRTENKADNPTELLKNDIAKVFCQMNGIDVVKDRLCIKQEFEEHPVNTQMPNTLMIKSEQVEKS